LARCMPMAAAVANHIVCLHDTVGKVGFLSLSRPDGAIELQLDA